MGITAHFIGVGFTFKSHVISFKKLLGGHTGKKIVEELIEVVNFYKIKSKIVRVVTDNGSNVVKAMKFFNNNGNDSESNDNYEDPSDLSDEGLIEDSLVETDEEISEVDEKSEDESTPDHWSDIFDDAIDMLNNAGYTSTNLRCYAHTMQLLIKESLKKITSLSALTKKFFAIAQKSHNIQEFSEMIETRKLKSIPKFNATRWNSELESLRGVSLIYSQECNTVEDILTRNGLAHLKLKPGQKLVLDEIIDILTPFEIATDLLQGESYCTISQVAPTILQLLSQLKEFNDKYGIDKKNNNSRHTTSANLVKNLEENIRKRFKGT